MPNQIDPATLQKLLGEAAPRALLDVREHGEYNTAHIPGASTLPRRQIEIRLRRLVPVLSVPVVLCDDDGRRAALAAVTLERMGYTHVSVLAGGVNGWASEGFPTEWGMNVSSKDFGEAVEVRHHVPTIHARELDRRLREGERLVILDTRTPEEYRRACIPGGRSVPGGELALHITDIAREHPGATVVVNCAGRTRSIIGARALQRMGLTNVVSLRNGTSGWVLAGLELERGAGRVDLPPLSEAGKQTAAAYAARVAAEDSVRRLSVRDLQALLARAGADCLYPIDVRSRAEFDDGHVPGFWWMPGGQAVQRADDVVAVRNGTIVFVCDSGVRSAITASWYRQMSFPNVCVLDGGLGAWTAAGLPLESGPAEAPVFGLDEAARAVRDIAARDLQAVIARGRGALVLFVETSDAFARGHVPGARWLSRSWLELRTGEFAPARGAALVVSDSDGTQATLAAATLQERGYHDVQVLGGGMQAWRDAGLPVEQGLGGVMAAPEDVVPAGPDRGMADMIHYLAWEEELGRKFSG